MLIHQGIHILYGDYFLHPLTPEKLTFLVQLIKGGFKIPSAKEAAAKRKDDSKKKIKLPDTTVVDRVIAGRSTLSGLIKYSP